jgi:hypothetical protein
MRKTFAAALATAVAVTMAPVAAAHTQPPWSVSYETDTPDDPDTPDVTPDDDVTPPVPVPDEDDEADGDSLQWRPPKLPNWLRWVCFGIPIATGQVAHIYCVWSKW